MKRAGRIASFAAMTFLAAATPSYASIVEITSRALAGTDLIDWSQLGLSLTPVPNGTMFTSTSAVAGSIGFATSGTGSTEQQGNDWFGNFSPNDFLLWTFAPGNGPLTLTFNSPVSSVGAQIQADFQGAFTAQIEAFDGVTPLGTFTEGGTSNGNGDGSAIFLGVLDTMPDITSITFSLTSCSFDCADFAINQVSLSGGVPVPEPSSLTLLGASLVGLGLIRRRRRQA